MVGTRRAMAARRAAATPLPGATWQANVVDAAAITKALNRLWSQFAADAAGAADADRSREAEPRSLNVLTRASTLNLIAVAQSTGGAACIEDAVRRLSDLYPSRATILVANPERQAEGEPGLDVRVALLEQPAKKGHPAIRFESVTVEVSAENERQLASIVSPLLVADLPDFLWWAGEATAGSALFDDLIKVIDRLIVDTATVDDPSGELRHLAETIAPPHGCPKLSDFAWARLAPWRQVVTQFFDPPAAHDAIAEIDEVHLAYGAPPAAGTSGLSAALLFAGWLATRLGWHTPGEMVPVRGTPGAWRVTLRAGGRRHRREVALTLRPSEATLARESLAEVAISAGGGAAGTFRVERIDALGLATWSDVPETPAAHRVVYADLPDEAALLADELRVFGRDAVYEAALAFAAELAPNDSDEDEE